MVDTYTAKNSRRYRYYVCLTAQQRGWDTCPTKSVAAQEIEDAIVSRMKQLGSDPRIAAEAARKISEQGESPVGNSKQISRLQTRNGGVSSANWRKWRPGHGRESSGR